jgi:Region found in RelA / SpoT proteins
VDPKQFRRQYMQLMPDLNQAMDHVKSKLSDLPPSDFAVETNLKPYTSIKRKMLSNNLRSPSDLSDLVRGRIYFSEQFQFAEVIRILQQLFGSQIKQVQKKPDSEHGLEYHGTVNADLDVDGIPFELQLLPQEFQQHEPMLHRIHQLFCNPKEVGKFDDKQQEFLKKTHNKIYRSLSQKAKENRS